MKNSKNIVSPYGRLEFPHVDTPDTRFGTTEKYSLDLVLDAELPDVNEYLNKIMAIAKSAHVENGTLPIRNWKDRHGNFSGEKVIKFRSRYQPKVFDAANRPLDVKAIGRGSIVRVSAAANIYNVGGKSGMNLYLNAVQVKVLEEPTPAGAEAYGFTVEASVAAAVERPEDPFADEKKGDGLPF